MLERVNSGQGLAPKARVNSGQGLDPKARVNSGQGLAPKAQVNSGWVTVPAPINGAPTIQKIIFHKEVRQLNKSALNSKNNF